MDRSGELVTKNLVVPRLEGRFDFVVKRPNAFVEIDLTAQRASNGVNLTRRRPSTTTAGMMER